MNNLNVPLQTRIADLERELSRARKRIELDNVQMERTRRVLEYMSGREKDLTRQLAKAREHRCPEAQADPPPLPLPHRLFWALMTARVVAWLALGCFGVILLLCAWGLLALLWALGGSALRAVGL